MNAESPNEPESPTHPVEGVMNFWDHVEELRWTLLKIIVAFTVAFSLVLGFGVKFAGFLQWPLRQAFAMMGTPDREILLRTDGPNNVFMFILQLGFFGGLALTLPFALYFGVQFIAPGLTNREKSVLKPVCLSILGLFLAGLLLAFFLLCPFYLYVSLQFEQMFNFASLWTPTKYYGIIVWTSLGLGLIFQSPLVIILLVYLGIVDIHVLRRSRHYAMFVILIIAALLTPGADPITLLFTAVPLYVLYEGSLFVGGRLRVRKEIADAREQEEWDNEYRD